MAKAWGGRFKTGTERVVEQFTESISFDHRLFREDVAGSIAHAIMLADVGLLTREEAKAIERNLIEIGEEIAAGRMEFDISLEDIHLHIESDLIRRLGDVGRKLHTGRSRNDQVATDLRLWVRRRLDELDMRLFWIQDACVAAGERATDLILPAYTHLQRAQPVRAAHYFLAYVEKYQRDRERAADCRRRVNVLPLGSAAVAGTSLPIDRQRVADLLKFDRVAANSMDATSDRDFLLESVFVLTMVAEHLSSWAEEWILWSTTEFGFLRLPDALCTGSSIMPQKKNPDVLELIRGKSAGVIGDLQTLLVLVKGLPLAYNRDLQEDKPPLFHAFDTVLACLLLAAKVIEGAEFDRANIDRGLDRGYLDATTLMERLIRFNVPMRSAHEIVGMLVRKCEEQGCRLSDLPAADLESAAPGRSEELRAALGVENALSAFASYGSTNPDEVAKQLTAWRTRLRDDEARLYTND
jgi:argininosuccinate lyase